MTVDEITKRFVYHSPTDEKVIRHTQVREAAINFAILVDSLTPDGREKALCLTNLEEAVFWANAAIARENK